MRSQLGRSTGEGLGAVTMTPLASIFRRKSTSRA